MKGIKYNSFDIAKFIGAIMVIAIHTNPMLCYADTFAYDIYNMFVSLAVPFFFVVSSYLFFDRNREIYEKGTLVVLKENIFKWIRLYLIWTILYLPCTIFVYIEKDYTIGFSIIHFIRGVLFIGHHNFSWPLWYLLALIYAMSFCYIMLKKKVDIKIITYIAVVFFVIGIGINYLLRNSESFNGIMANFTNILNYILSSGRLFISVIYIVFGMLIALEKINWLKNIKWKLVQIFICAFLRCIVPEYIDEFIKFYMVILIFMELKKLQLKNAKIWYFLRRASTIMFYCHMFFYFIYVNILEKLFVGISHGFCFFFVLICTVAFALVLILYEQSREKCWVSKIM